MAVRNWLKGQYPTLALKESWLSQAAAEAAQSGPSSQHIRSVNASLLKTDLAKLTNTAALPKDVATWKTGKLATGQREAILVQVVGKLGELARAPGRRGGGCMLTCIYAATAQTLASLLTRNSTYLRLGEMLAPRWAVLP